MTPDPEGEWVRDAEAAALIVAARAVPADVVLETTAEERALWAKSLNPTWLPADDTLRLISDVNTLTATLAASTAREKAKDAEIAELQRQIKGYQHHIDEAEQEAGKALGYPWYKDDQKNFPGATEENGVCIGEHVVDTIVAKLAAVAVQEVAKHKNVTIADLEARLAEAEDQVSAFTTLFGAKPAELVGRLERERDDALASLETAERRIGELTEAVDGLASGRIKSEAMVIVRAGVKRALANATAFRDDHEDGDVQTAMASIIMHLEAALLASQQKPTSPEA
jgi:hypothetical protein